MFGRFARYILLALLLAPSFAFARRQSSAAQTSAPPTSADFLRATDQVLAQMSRLIDLPVLQPLKKDLRSKAQIRAYLVQEEKTDTRPAKRYADEKALEAFGLIPRGFDLDGFMVNLLTDQVAGYYDSKQGEFFIADWIPVADQRMVMAHELTHALQDQHFHIDSWLKAARPNDDAASAREAVLEGSATVSMIDYELRGLGTSVRAMPDISALTQMAVGQAAATPGLDKAPPYLRDSLLFPYLDGAVFTQHLLKAGDGWPDFYKVFSRPPLSTQQIMQPSYYLEGKAPPPVALPPLGRLLGRDWKLLDENVVGEFGLEEVLKQYLPASEATGFAPDWWGDRYAILENRKTKSSLLLFLLQLDSASHASAFFDAYKALLLKKHGGATGVVAAPESLQFQSPDGGVYFECRAAECFSMEGGSHSAFQAVTRAIDWAPASVPSRPSGPSPSGR